MGRVALLVGRERVVRVRSDGRRRRRPALETKIGRTLAGQVYRGTESNVADLHAAAFHVHDHVGNHLFVFQEWFEVLDTVFGAQLANPSSAMARTIGIVPSSAAIFKTVGSHSFTPF